jgi:multimeric flavodoxin WrbA
MDILVDPPKKTLLLVWHSRTGTARQMTAAAAAGADHIASELSAREQLTIRIKVAHETNADDLLGADGYIFCAPENLASLSGAMKEFFDRNYYDVLERLNGRPYLLMISAGSDGSGAARQAERICTGWRLRAVAPVLIVNTEAQTTKAILAPKSLKAEDRIACEAQGGLLAATLLM